MAVTRSGLEKTITAAVQQASFDCHGFINVFVEHARDDDGANWRIKGIKYGRAPRGPCDTALDEIVRSLRTRYLLETPRSAVRQLAMPVPTNRRLPRQESPLAAAVKRQSSEPL